MTEPAPFDPEAILRVLGDHGVRYVLVGGLAATLYGSPYVTTDVDIAPDRSPDNLRTLANALEEVEARMRVEGEPNGLPFDRSAEMLARLEILNLTTRYGDLDIAFVPTGTRGYDDLRRNAIELTIHDTQIVVAALADVIRSKQASNREKDRLTLPTLRRLLERLGAGE
jgi:predicted nucleotidyltransferase